MATRLDGKVALITGAAGDLGRAATRLFLERGARVVGFGLNVDGLEAGSDQLHIAGDTTEESQVASAVARAREAFGGLDILFAAAGVEGGTATAWAPIAKVSKSDFERVFAVNVTGVFLSMKYAIPAMVERGGGAIVNVASVAALRPAPGQIAYSASKAAVIGMTRTAALEWGGHGVRANCVAPGPLEGRMMESIAGGMRAALPGGEPAGLRGGMIPLGRWGRVEEVAEVAAFLASDQAAFITGSVYPVDGGLTA